MERKNTVLLTVIAVATLLVAVVGATFAYFTATNEASDIGGSKADVTTTVLGGTSFTFNGSNETYKYLSYPGGLAVFGAKASFEKTDKQTDKNNYDLTFDLAIDYSNNTETNLLWALYMVEGDALAEKLDPKCKLVEDTETKAGETHYWYNNDGNRLTTSSCTLDESQTTDLSNSTMIAYGSLAANQTDGHIKASDDSVQSGTNEGIEGNAANITSPLYNPDSSTNNPLKGRTLNSDSITEKSYYLVVQYPNENETQNEGNEQKAISVTLKVEEGTPSAVVRKTA